MIWNFLLVFLLVALNGLFVAAEFAFVKLRLQEVKILAEGGGRAPKLLERIMLNLDAYLSACQLGITLASLGLGWVGEPLVAKSLEPLFEYFDVPENKVHYIAFPVAFMFITFLHITLGEQVPKILAIKRYKSTSLATSLPIVIFYKIFKPFIWALNGISNVMLRAIGIQMQSEHGEVLSEDELRAILLESASVGHLTLRERLLMENVLDLEDKIARRYMIPRNQIIYLDKNDSMEEKLKKASESNHTRLPLCDGDLDNIIGVVHVKDIFQSLAKNENLTHLIDVARDATFIPETAALDVLLREFQKNNAVLAILVDEHGTVSGMITLENVLEELVGPIQDEFDSETPLIIKKGDDIFEVDASCTVDEIKKRLQIEVSNKNADTIGGVLTEEFGHIPEIGEKIVVDKHEYKVLEAQPKKIVRMEIRKLSPDELEEIANEGTED